MRMANKQEEKKTAKKKTKQQIIDDLRKQKKKLQEVRFRLSAEAQQKTSRHKELRNSIARMTTMLTEVKKEQKNGNTRDNPVSRV